MIPTLLDIVRMLLSGELDHETAQSYLTAHQRLQDEADDVLPYVPAERSRVLFDTIYKRDEQVKRWGLEESNYDFDPALVANADASAAGLSSFYHLPNSRLTRMETAAAFEANEGTWMHIVVEEVSKLPDHYEDPRALYNQLIDLAGVSIAWAERLVDRGIVPMYVDQPESASTPLDTYIIHKDGTEVGRISCSDAREAGTMAADTWGPGEYNVKLVREEADHEGPGEDEFH